MEQGRVIIVGAGIAGAEAAMALRRDGYVGEVLLIGNETHPPYDRPPLSKKALAEGGDTTRLYLRESSAYATAQVDLRLATAVSSLDPARRSLRLADGSELFYDHCILATGAAPWLPPVPGMDLPGLVVLRDLDDMIALRDRVAPELRNVVILGGGYLGLELAASLRGLGLDVTVIEAAQSILARSASPLCAADLQARHERAGNTILTGTPVAAILGQIAAEGVQLADGRQIAADLVICATGARPRIDLAVSAGLDCDNAIVVDERCETSRDGIFAIGDCASYPSAMLGRRCRLESIQAATFQARTVSGAICGKRLPAERVPYFWSEQFGMKLQIAGIVDPGQPCRDERVGDTEDSFAIYRFQGDRLAAVETLNRPRDFVLAQSLIGKPGVSQPPVSERQTA